MNLSTLSGIGLNAINMLFLKKLSCLFLGHKWHTKSYSVLIINTRIVIECSKCNKLESYFGDGTIWKSMLTFKNAPIGRSIFLADEQAYQHWKSLTSNIYNDHCS